jgi:hypothetical protein
MTSDDGLTPEEIVAKYGTPVFVSQVGSTLVMLYTDKSFFLRPKGFPKDTPSSMPITPSNQLRYFTS